MRQRPPRRQASTQPPPDSNLDASMHQSVIRLGKGAITFALPPGQPHPDAVSLQRRAAVQALEKTLYILTLAQQALFAGRHMDTATHLPPPPPSAFSSDTITGVYPSGGRKVPSIQLHTNNAFLPQILANKVVNSIKGKPRSLMQPQPLADVHPFTPTMKQ
jgi:hypothetical protein